MQDLENAGYEFEAAEASFDLLVKKAAGLYVPKFERLAYRVNIEADADGAAGDARRRSRCASATRCMHTVSEGDGPVNALDGAPAQGAAGRAIPRLAEMHLVDYKVRVVNARAETAARVRVVIEWRDGDARLGHGRRQRERHRGVAGWRWRTRSSTSCSRTRRVARRKRSLSGAIASPNGTG